ncbi:unnamed protein product [Ophioblennius macclurei]
MASGHLSREEALACTGCKHACHVMLYCDTKAIRRNSNKHVILMQMRFDGLLGFPGGLVEPLKETLEAGLTRELLEELGVALPISEEHHVAACHAPPPSPSSSSSLMLHFYVKKLTEEQIKEVELAAVSTAKDHGDEVMGMVRVPLYTLRSGKGLGSFLSHAFIGNSRSQLLDAILHLDLVAPHELHKALSYSLEGHAHTGKDLRAALAIVEERRRRF